MLVIVVIVIITVVLLISIDRQQPTNDEWPKPERGRGSIPEPVFNGVDLRAARSPNPD
jgi:hypothetical protein